MRRANGWPESTLSRSGNPKWTMIRQPQLRSPILSGSRSPTPHLWTQARTSPQKRLLKMQRRNDAPQRTCVGCMTRDSRTHMFRIAASGDTLIVDEEGRSQGRGAYLHYRNRCITSFGHSKAKVLQSLKRRVSRDERFKL